MQEQIFDALRRNASAEALALAQSATEADPAAPRPQLWLAMALRAAGRGDEAIVAIDRAIALAPDDADLHFHRAGLLLGRSDVVEARSALSTTLALDPNQFAAYILQAQLALGRGEFDEAERQNRLAARIAPEHPWCRTVDGLLALRRGRNEEALRLLSQAAEQLPDDGQVLQALGFAFLANDHLAFAEQAFARLLERSPGLHVMRPLLAQTLLQQGRAGDALEALAPMLEAPGLATPALLRHAGRLALVAGQPRRALPWLKSALEAQPGDPVALLMAMDAWRRSGDAEDARGTLDALLATSPGVSGLWRARLSLERVGDPAAGERVDRWIAALPGDVAALEARLLQLDAMGEAEAAEATAREIVAIEPGRSSAERYLIDRLMQRDPAAAVAHVEGLLARAGDDGNRDVLRGWLGLAQDRAGDAVAAVATWAALNAEAAPDRLPLPEPGAPQVAAWTAPAPADDAPATVFVFGPPGSQVERLATVLRQTVRAFRADRFDASPPDDLLQAPGTARRLAAGELAPAQVAASWRAQLPARGLDERQAVDWLPWWDNGLLPALREQFPHASVLLAVRDPRDMLLDWLAFGAPAPFRIESPVAAAAWLARLLEHLAQLHESDAFPHRLAKLDDAVSDPDALSALLGDALRTPVPVLPAARLGPPRFPAGHWRHYAGALAEPFALLAPVAARLGYPEG